MHSELFDVQLKVRHFLLIMILIYGITHVKAAGIGFNMRVHCHVTHF